MTLEQTIIKAEENLNVVLAGTATELGRQAQLEPDDYSIASELQRLRNNEASLRKELGCVDYIDDDDDDTTIGTGVVEESSLSSAAVSDYLDNDDIALPLTPQHHKVVLTFDSSAEDLSNIFKNDSDLTDPVTKLPGAVPVSMSISDCSTITNEMLHQNNSTPQATQMNVQKILANREKEIEMAPTEQSNYYQQYYYHHQQQQDYDDEEDGFLQQAAQYVFGSSNTEDVLDIKTVLLVSAAALASAMPCVIKMVCN